jgi:hypothetical protein
VTDRPIRLVLDTSAVVAYTRGSIHVGEVLSEISDEQGAAALPLACLVEAAPAVADSARLMLLVNHPATSVLADGAELWQSLAAMREVVGRPDSASAALSAIDFDVDVLTRWPRLYDGIGYNMVIPIEE